MHSDNQPAKHNRNVCWGGGWDPGEGCVGFHLMPGINTELFAGEGDAMGWDPGEGCVGFHLMPGINTELFAGEGDAMGWDGSIISARYMYKSLAR